MRIQSFLKVGFAHITTKSVCEADRLQTSFGFLTVIRHGSDGYHRVFWGLGFGAGFCFSDLWGLGLRELVGAFLASLSSEA